MHVMIMTLGTRGDVQPYVALGKGLLANGHQVTICTSQRFETFITDHGLDYGYMNDEALALIDSEEVRALMGNVSNVFTALKMAAKMSRRVGPLQKMMIADSWAATEQANPDVIIFHQKAYGATHFAEKLGIPTILAPTLPQFVPTANFAAIGFPKLPLGGGYNRFTYNLTRRLTVMGISGYTNRWRKAHGLKPKPRWTDFLLKQDGVPITVMHPLSKHALPVPQDWPENIHMQGYWFLEDSADYTPPADLQQFLDAGDAPVYVGFGSMVGTRVAELTATIIAGIQQAGVRAVLAKGWGGLESDDLPDSIFMIDHAPHDWLFPRMAAVVHHGGAGTTAAGLRAGKPTLVTPHFGDQPFWGERMFELGVGPAPIPQKKLTADNFAEALRELVTNQAMQAQAAEIGRKISAEDGVANAVAIVEHVVSSYRA